MSDSKSERWQEIARERLKRHGGLTMRTFETACKRIAELEDALAKEKKCSDRLLSQLAEGLMP